jgi:hypothetical protein
LLWLVFEHPDQPEGQEVPRLAGGLANSTATAGIAYGTSTQKVMPDWSPTGLQEKRAWIETRMHDTASQSMHRG